MGLWESVGQDGAVVGFQTRGPPRRPWSWLLGVGSLIKNSFVSGAEGTDGFGMGTEGAERARRPALLRGRSTEGGGEGRQGARAGEMAGSGDVRGCGRVGPTRRARWRRRNRRSGAERGGPGG